MSFSQASRAGGARPYIGGQAVLEGVMMRAPGGVAVAVRRPDGSLVVRDGPLPKVLRAAIWTLPGLRGIATLAESLSLGYSALEFSAEQQEEAGRARAGAGLSSLLVPLRLLTSVADGFDDAPESGPGSSAPAPESAWRARSRPARTGSRAAMVFATVLALGLFIALPQLLATGTGWLLGVDLGLGDWRFHALTGFFKLLVLTAYLATIAQIPEVQRVFQYHGAEHKTIHAYEAGLPLCVEQVRRQSTLHPRCGTTFLIVVVLVSVVLGSVMTPWLLPDASGFGGQLATLALRIAILPLVAAIAYEIQRFLARCCTRGPLRVLLWPGFLFQRITTREPDDAQIEVAIAALQAAFWRQRHGERAPARDQIHHFPSLEGALAHYA
jgi:uncharacterized protein YqhQ